MPEHAAAPSEPTDQPAAAPQPEVAHRPLPVGTTLPLRRPPGLQLIEVYDRTPPPADRAFVREPIDAPLQWLPVPSAERLQALRQRRDDNYSLLNRVIDDVTPL